MNEKIFWRVLSLCLILAWGFPAFAQSGGYAHLTQPNFERFPEITTYLDIYNQDNRFITGLTENDISLVENGQKRPITQFKELSPGIQMVIAINIAPPFAIQDITGKSRWDYVSEHITLWLQENAGNGRDDLSILSNDGLERTHTEKEDILKTLHNYQPQPRETTPNLNILARAIDLAMDPTPQTGMKPVVLYLTPPPTPEEIGAIQNITNRAKDENVRVYIWLISAPDYFNDEGADQLRSMSQQTRGQFFAFSGQEKLPPVEDLFLPLRGTYLLSYHSAIKSQGPHQLRVSINHEGKVLTASRELPLNILPPNPILVPPPREIERTNPDTNDGPTPLKDYRPSSLAIEGIIEFPDGHPRALQKTVLLVDGEPRGVNTSPPFDQFSWDLSQYARDQTHYLSIQAVDSLGLSQTSVQTPVKIKVTTPEPTINNILQQNTLGFISLAGILISALILFLLLSRGIIQPKSILTSPLSDPKTRRGQNQENHQRAKKTWELRKLFPKYEKGAEEKDTHYGKLEPYNDEAKVQMPQGIPLDEKKIQLGRNSERVSVPLNHDSISGLHASLDILSETQFQLQDPGSKAGTWVNFQQIPHGYGVPVHHGDIIHFGKLGFQFISAHPDANKEIIVTEEKGT